MTKVICYSKETYRIIQEHLFKYGYKWCVTGSGIWYPTFGNGWKSGKVIKIDEYNKILFSYSRKEYDITDEKYIWFHIKKDFKIEDDIIKMFDSII